MTNISSDLETDPRGLETEYFEDASKTVVSQNNSPDLPFRYGLNPYRGCIHGCSYARPTHEFLGLDAGLDFESRIIVKRNAPDLLPGLAQQTKLHL